MKEVFIIAGESSGDMHGAALVEEVGRIDPEIRFRGIGGPKLAAAGAELFLDITEHAAVGLMETLMGAKQLLGAYRLICRKLRDERPDAIVLIDFPDFNLRVARHAHKLGVRVIYYISPQIWAWRSGRVRQIERNVDQMLVIFPFEVDFYSKHGVKAEFVGHPLIDMLSNVPDKHEARELLELDPDASILGLLPGSRRKEIETLLPMMLDAATRLRADRPELKIVLGAAPGFEPLIREIVGEVLGRLSGQPVDPQPGGAAPHVRIIEGNSHAAMAASDLVLIASGTATVEAMILNVPMVVTYRVALGTYLAFAWLLKVSRFAMPNIVAGRTIVPELMQWQANADNLHDEATRMLDAERLARAHADLAAATAKLGSGGASAAAAKRVVAAFDGEQRDRAAETSEGSRN